MKKLIFVIPFLYFLMILFSCSAPKAVQLSIPSDHIEFGFMNQKNSVYNAYVIIQNGQLFQKNVIDSKYTLLKKINQKDADFIYNTVAQLKSGNSNLYQIGDEIIFVRIRKNGTMIQEWKWLKGNEDIPSDIKQMERLFIDILDDRMR